MGQPDPFLRFDAVILSPPWPAAIALAVVLGVFWLALQVARGQQGAHGAGALAVAASFVLLTAFVATLVQVLAWFGAATTSVLRGIGICLTAAGAGLLSPSCRGRAQTSIQSARARFRQGTALQRWALLASGVTVLGLGLAAFGPPTDIDTLAYHLSVPLDWLAYGGVRATPDWLHARLVGAGESLNLLGLAMGTDCLGAVFQAAGLLVAVTAITGLATSAADRVFAWAMVASCPLLPFLTLTSKPQLMPAAATTVALALFVWHRRTAFEHLNVATLWLICGCTSFAAACKYSFIPSAIVVAILVVGALRGTVWAGKAVLVGLSAFTVITLPVYVRNLLFYGDPMSPMLEGLRQHADPVVTTFSWYLRNFSGGRSLGHLIRLPWNLVVATRPGQLTNVLGVGALAMLVLPGRKIENWDIPVAAAAGALIVVATGQLGARFFFESYLWIGMAAVLTSWNKRKQFLFAILSLQLAVAMPVAAYGAASLLPAALNAEQRERAMMRLAPDYALSQWLDRVLPKGAVLATDRRSSLFLPRRALHSDLAQMVSLSPLSESAKRERIEAVLASGGADTLVVTSPPESSPYGSLAGELGPPKLISPSFADAVRNPWNQNVSYTVMIYDLRATRSQRRPR